MTPQPHCEHECVCMGYAQRSECYQANASCRKPECKHDTRSRPAPTASEYKFTCWRGDCKLHDACIHLFGQEYPPCVDACAQQAKAAAAKTERARVLKPLTTIHERIKHLKPLIMSEDAIQYAAKHGDHMRVLTAEMFAAIEESLRGEQEKEATG